MTTRTWEDELKAEFAEEIPTAQALTQSELARLLPAVLTREECKKLLEYYQDDETNGPRNKLIIRVFYATGVRIAEIAELRFCDIFWDTKLVFVRGGKGEKDRYACIDGRTLEMIKNFQSSLGQGLEAKIFDISDRQIRRVVEKAGDETGIAAKYTAMGRVFSPHSFRHSFATHCYENGMRIFTLKKILGHEYIGTTEIYINTATNYDSMEYERSNPFLTESQAQRKL
ncbi:MAG: tyrosine-type recombinase/integrase [Candidatus Wallbacteria bacterium]|nr:tyrosine-type recombinase/integrase [Candidatus Wallbacteria bacterium]